MIERPLSTWRRISRSETTPTATPTAMPPRKTPSGSSSTSGSVGKKAIARPPRTRTIGAGILPKSASRTSTAAARRRTKTDSTLFIDHITSGSVSELLSPSLEEIDHVRGEAGAPLELVMFGDFQCPFCLGAEKSLRRARERLGEGLLFGFRHLPIPEKHPLAMEAAEASEAAAAP